MLRDIYRIERRSIDILPSTKANMSFLPNLSNWALSGGAGDDPNDQNNNNEENDEPMQQESEEEIRAKRLARLAAMSNRTASNASNNDTSESVEKKTPAKKLDDSNMDIDPPSNNSANTVQMKPVSPPTANEVPRKRKEPSKPTADPMKKLQRKKELLLKKTLKVKLANSSVADSSDLLSLDITEITVDSISEIIASRLESTPLSCERNFFFYLSQSFKRTCEEIQNIPQNTNAAVKELQALLLEIKKQLVSYSATSIMVPDLFANSQNAGEQLANLLTASTMDPINNITMGIMGKNSSYWYMLCEELFSQDPDSFEKLIQDIAENLLKDLSKCESVLDSNNGNGALVQLASLTAMCSYKKAAVVLAKSDNFLLPPENTAEASEKVQIPVPQPPSNATPEQVQIFRMMTMMTQGRQSYLKRSGPGLEKHTLLGNFMRIGIPMDSVTSQFQNMARTSRSEVQKRTDTLRRQLKVYQDALNTFVKCLMTSGEEARTPVLKWYIDALLVNIGATALRPDKMKVSTPTTLSNITITLLKLCEPFFNDVSRIHPGFVWTEEEHGGIYSTTGDDVVSRLGDHLEPPSAAYDVKNKFIPKFFFLCARSLHLSLVASASYHQNLCRQLSHIHYTTRQRNEDLASNPQFNQLLSMQFANEVALLAPDMVSDALKFFNLSAGFLLKVDDEALSLMPEHMVDDICDYLDFVTRFASDTMGGVDLSNVFKVVVKLLSPQYASVVRNYNLRAKLGDVLYDVYLPSSGSNRSSVPTSVSCDPKMGGMPYLLSDSSAQETLAPSLLLLYGEVEHTGYYDKMGHRANIASLLQFLWESKEHRSAFKRITQNKDSFIKFANGIMNEMNSLIVTVMEKLPEMRTVQIQMGNPQEWAALSEEDRERITSRHEENENEVKRALHLCNKTFKMLGFLSTDEDIRGLFLLDELCPRLVNMLLHVLAKLVGSKGIELKVRSKLLANEIHSKLFSSNVVLIYLYRLRIPKFTISNQRKCFQIYVIYLLHIPMQKSFRNIVPRVDTIQLSS